MARTSPSDRRSRALDRRLSTSSRSQPSASKAVRRTPCSEESIRIATARHTRGELRASRLCSRLRIRSEDLDAWIAANHVDPAERVGAPPPLAPAHNGLRRLLATSERKGER